ncbi:RNA polymerase subunit sigma-70 [Actinomadura rupiterrae]|uniref:RNA polymerase subunit sigma-70 n=1 Tax=Actinomadura rupiterrae TaxID=559627 RepID=UPI0020A4F451|nr:RNA polymerase subunit sigma-70 [Actinomadura rupiterrae]MCP2338025.1 RNA polymerase sigma-70 factor (ECF subfamily) [Actinomadura rupiterrae]
MDHGDRFEEIVAPYRDELFAHCYRMLGGVHDAEDALQDAFVGAWKGLDGFEERSSLYRIATNACLKVIRERPRRLLSADLFPALDSPDDLGEPVEAAWIEPLPDPAEGVVRREGVELAFVAALQHLPGTQRAVLILREVLGFSAAEAAEILGTSVPSVNSALQRARGTLEKRTPIPVGGGDDRAERELVGLFMSAWERADVPALLGLLAEDARFTMPPLPAWFDGRDGVERFLRERIFQMSWRLVPTRANAQPAFAAYVDGRLAGLNVLTVRDGWIAEVTSFLDPRMFEAFGISENFPG